MAAAVPAQRERPLLTMADMGHGGMSGMDHGNRAGMDHSQMQQSEEPPATEQPMSELGHAAMGHAMPQAAEPVPDQQPMSGMDHAAMGHGTMPTAGESQAQQPLSGTDHVAKSGNAAWRERVCQSVWIPVVAV